MKIKYLLIFLFTINYLSVFSQTNTQKKQTPTKENTGLVKWLTIEQAEALNKKQPKPFLIDFYTEWCGWCKHMMKTTYSNPQIAGYINERFYPVRFDAETHDTIHFQGKEYVNTGVVKRSSHQFAQELMEGRMSYPTTLFMSSDYKIKLRVPGYLDSKKIEPFLVYMVEYVFGTTNINDFTDDWNMAFNDSTTDQKTIKWYGMNEALRLQKKQKRPIVIYVNTDWCNSCKVMKRSTFLTDTISKYLDKKFYLVDFNAQSQDTIKLGEQIFFKTKKDVFHPFISQIENGRVVLPSLIFIDENGKVLSSVPFYHNAYEAETIFHFFGEDFYKTQKWNDFYKSFKHSLTKKYQ